MKYRNLAEMFFCKKNDYPDLIAYQFKKAGQWSEVPFRKAVDISEKYAAGMASMGLKKGDKVAIISHNLMDWALIDYACAALGCILVPIYPSLLKDQVLYILNDSESKVVFAQDDIQLEKVDAIRKDINQAGTFIVMEQSGQNIPEPWIGLSHLVENGENYLKTNSDCISKSIETVALDDVHTIIYTSGTTGEPKGAILTHRNFLSNIDGVSDIIDFRTEDVFLSFLPLSHVFERMAGHFLPTYFGSKIAYAESIDSVAENMGEVQPTLMVSVPRLYEKMYGRVLENAEAGSAIKQKIFNWSIQVGRAYIYRKMKHQSVSPILQMKRNLAYKLVFSKLNTRVGGRLRYFVSGGAPLSPEIAEFFGSAGLMILEGYGLTETSPVISVNRPERFKFGTVGPKLDNVEVKIGDDGEILSRGDHIMKGYFKKEAETKEVIDEDGWFHTGDIGLIDEDGFLKITDRKKNIIVTSGGKNIAPQPIENSLINSKYIEQAVVVGDQRRYCTAIIVPNQEQLENWAKENEITFENFENLVEIDLTKSLIRKEIDRLTENLASYETIKDFHLTPTLFSIETGDLTPSLKVKRKVVEEKYKKVIDAMYNY